jgi:hypothetical protein
MYMRLTDLKNPDSPRECIVLPRQGKSERYVLTFEDGQLVETNAAIPVQAFTGIPKIAVKAVSLSRFERFLSTLKVGDEVVWTPESGMGRATFYRGLKTATKMGKVYKVDGVSRKAEFGDETETETVSPSVSVSSEKPFSVSASD